MTSQKQLPNLIKAGPKAYNDQETINRLDHLKLLSKPKESSFITAAIAFVLSIIISLALPKIFNSASMFQTPQQDTKAMVAL